MSEPFNVAEHLTVQSLTQRTEERRGGLRFTVPLRSSVLCVKSALAEFVRDGQLLKGTVEEKEMNTTKYELNASLPAVKNQHRIICV